MSTYMCTELYKCSVQSWWGLTHWNLINYTFVYCKGQFIMNGETVKF